MNKITKLLSVFVIAGAVGCGVASFSGCGHTHNATKYGAVAATCTQDGTKEYYTCDGADCAGKYFSDEACTQEITDITVPATGHTKQYTDKGDGTHGITCVHDDLTETTEAHVDENGDNLCDKCSAKFLVAGKYFNLEAYSSDEEIEIKADGKIVYNGNEYTVSVADDGEATFEANGKTYTLTKTASGYMLSHTSETSIAKEYYGKKSETVTITDADAFIGTYTGELVYSDGYGTFKVTKIAITENWQVLFTQIKIGDAEGNPEQGVTYSSATTVLDNIIGDTLTNNDFTTYYYHFIAQTVENNEVESLNLVYNSESALFTKVSGTTDEVVTSLPLGNFTYYVDADNNYSLTAYESFATKIYEINGASKRFIMKDADGNYIVTFADSNNNDASLMLNIAADKQSIDVYTLDGATKITTLTPSTVTYPTIKVDGTANNNAVVDPFNKDYAYYKIETAGWYKITAAENDVILYTDVDFGTHTVGWTSVTVDAGKSKALQLVENSYIAVSSSYIANGFTATYSVEEPEPDYEAFTNGKYEIASFNGSNTYFVKGTVATAGKYYVTVDTTAIFGSNDRGAYFEIDGTKYGYEYSGSWAVTATGLTYEATLAEGAEVKVKVGCDNQYLLNGHKVVVYFETEEKYNARLEASKPEDFTGFTAAQQGTYSYDTNSYLGTISYEIGTDSVSLIRDGYPDELTFVSLSGGVYTYSLYGYNVSFSFDNDGNMAISSDNITDLGSYVAVKQGASGGEEESTGAKVGVNTVQAGIAGYAEITFSVPGTYTLSYDSSADNVYYIMVGGTMVANGGKFTVTDSVTIKVYVNDNSQVSKFTIAEAQAEEGGATEGGLVVGVNTISEFDSVFFTATVTFTATQAGTYTFEFADVYSTSTVSKINGTPLELNQYTGAATATLTLEANQTITIVVEQNMSGDNITITITKA